MDPRTALIIASLMALLNGGVLGLMHRSLLPEVQPSAVDWRIGTLLFAGAGILISAQNNFQQAFVLTIAYGLIFVGMGLYWRSCRTFFGLKSGLWLFAPAAVGTVAVYLFSGPAENTVLREVSISAAMLLPLLASGLTLCKRYGGETIVGGRVLNVLLLVLSGFILLRGLYFAVEPIWLAIAPAEPWVNIATVVSIPALPVIGTTIFLLMCAERGRLALQHTAGTDDLTGLPNRRTISHAGELRFEAARQAGRGFAIAVIDIDFFKQINDRHGHYLGDTALCHIATVLQRHCGQPHLLGRQGGEEFVALLEMVDRDSAMALAETLRRAIDDTPLIGDAQRLSITASIGVAVMSGDDRDYDYLLRRADSALYAAKARGRNRVEISGFDGAATPALG